jgi:MORN repeat variant
MTRHLVFFCGSLVLASCQNAKKEHLDDDHVIKRVFYEDGEVKIEQEFKNDSIQDGYYKKYFPNRNVALEIEFRNNKINGKELAYYEDGSIKSRSNFIDDKRDGEAIWYFKNGQDSLKLNYYDGILVGESYEYYSVGKLKYYTVYGFEGNLRFVIDYFENEQVDTVKGNGVADISINGNEFNLGDTLQGIFILATPPQSESKFYISEDLRFPNNKKELPIEQSCSCVRYERVFTKRGKLNWGGNLYIKFNDGKEFTYPFTGTSIVK